MEMEEEYKEEGINEGMLNVVKGYGDVGDEIVNNRMKEKVQMKG